MDHHIDDKIQITVSTDWSENKNKKSHRLKLNKHTQTKAFFFIQQLFGFTLDFYYNGDKDIDPFDKEALICHSLLYI